MKHTNGGWPAWLLTQLPVKFSRKRASNHTAATPIAEEHQQQLLIDVSVILQRDARTGIQRVVRSLLLQLRSAPPPGYCICPVFATRRHGYCYAEADFLERSAPTITRNVVLVKAHDGDVFLGLDLTAHLIPLHQAQILQWKRVGVKVHMVVYDLLPLQHPEWFNAKTTRNFKRWIRWVAVYADSAICISGNVKLEFQTWLSVKFNLPLGTPPVSTIVLGSNINESAPSGGIPPSAEFLLARLRTNPSVLMVGTLEPRKGYEQALAAFELLWQKNKQSPLLVIVGRPGWKTNALQKRLRQHSQSNRRLFWLDNVSDEFLERLYATCSGVLIASYAEGFGLPLVEAALHRKPVLARKLAVFKELDIPGVSYFSTDSFLTLATDIDKWMALPQEQNTPKVCNTVSGLPTWALAATQLLSAMGLQQTGLKSSATGKSQSNDSRRIPSNLT